MQCERCFEEVISESEHGVSHCPFQPRYAGYGVVGDELLGTEIRHLSHKPLKFDSKTDLKRYCNEHGWVNSGDTPAPYRVQWSGKRKDLKPDEQ